MKFEYIKDPAPGYYSAWVGGMKICLEHCFNGFEVAVYKGDWLLIPKICTDIKNYNQTNIVHVYHAFKKALKIAETMPERVRKAAQERDELREFA